VTVLLAEVGLKPTPLIVTVIEANAVDRDRGGVARLAGGA
jgi:hypothetical protein